MRQPGMNGQKVLTLITLAGLLLILSIVQHTVAEGSTTAEAASVAKFLSGKYDNYGTQMDGDVSRASGADQSRALTAPRLFGTLSIFLLLAPIVLLLAIPIVLSLFFTAIPVAAGRSLVTKLLSSGLPGLDVIQNNSIVEALGQIVESEECVERISCHIFKATGQYGMFEQIFSLLKMLPKNSSLTKRIVRGTNAKRSCISFTCPSFKKFWSSLSPHQQNHQKNPQQNNNVNKTKNKTRSDKI